VLSTANTLTKSKQTKPHGRRAPKLVRLKSVVAAAAKAPTMAPIAPSLIPNASMMTAATTMVPVIMLPPAGEFDMKMLEELNASVCGLNQCSSFILGEKRDHVIDIVRNVVTIHSSCEANKLATLTPKRWVNFILYCQQIENEAKELNLKTRPVAFRSYLGDGWYMSMTGGYNVWIFVVSTFLTVDRTIMCVLPVTVSVFVLTNGQNSWCLYRLFMNVIRNWLRSVLRQNHCCVDSADLA